MAKVELDDGSIISSSHYMDMLDKEMRHTSELMHMQGLMEYERSVNNRSVEKLKVPPGRFNRHRVLNISMYDLFVHIQESLSLNNRCIINFITNNEHRCPNTTDTIQRRIHQYAEQFIDNAFIELHPRTKIQYRIEGEENTFDYRWETDEEWNDRLCHLMMHQHHPRKLQMIKCEECLQEWLNSSKW